MEAVGHAGTCLGILAKDGIVLCAEKKNQHKLLDQNPNVAEKIYRIDDHCAVGIAGITADANALISQLRNVGEYRLISYWLLCLITRFTHCDFGGAKSVLRGLYGLWTNISVSCVLSEKVILGLEITLYSRSEHNRVVSGT